MFSKKIYQKEERIYYYGYNINENVRLKSSSGGIFMPLAKQILQQGGVVCGATYDTVYGVHHIIIDSMDQLEMLMGSKYVQSNIGNIFLEIKNLLEEEKRVLFVGTPCQVDALNRFLDDINTSGLITIDLLCHGTPSKNVYQKYLTELEVKYDAKVKQIDFRYKKYGWKRYSHRVEFSNNRVYVSDKNKDPYLRLFISGYILRSQCHNCKYRNINRVSDITLGDFWNHKEYTKQRDDNKGISVIFVNSQKGGALLRRVETDVCIMKIGNVECIENIFSIPQKEQKNYQEFWIDYSNLSIKELADKYVPVDKQNLLKNNISDAAAAMLVRVLGYLKKRK